MVGLALRPEPRPKARNLPTRYGARDEGAQANRIRRAGPVLRWASECVRTHQPRFAQPGSRLTFSGVAESERLAARTETLDYRLAAAGREAAEGERLDLLERIYDPVAFI